MKYYDEIGLLFGFLLILPRKRSVMSKQTLDIIEYTIVLVNEFAKRFGLSEADSFRYIDRYNGMKLIEQCYSIMHTLSFADSVDGMASFCRRNGGTL